MALSESKRLSQKFCRANHPCRIKNSVVNALFPLTFQAQVPVVLWSADNNTGKEWPTKMLIAVL